MVYVIHTQNKYDEHFFDVFASELDAVNECHNIIGEILSHHGDEDDQKELADDWQNWGPEMVDKWNDELGEYDSSVYYVHCKVNKETKKARAWRLKKEANENVTKNINRGRV